MVPGSEELDEDELDDVRVPGPEASDEDEPDAAPESDELEPPLFSEENELEDEGLPGSDEELELESELEDEDEGEDEDEDELEGPTLMAFSTFADRESLDSGRGVPDDYV